MRNPKDYDDGLEAAAQLCDDRMDAYLERAEQNPRTSIEFTMYSGVATQARIMGEKIRGLKADHQAIQPTARYNNA